MHRVDADGLNLRSEPSADSRRTVRAVLRRGERVTRLREVDAQWWEVRVERASGSLVGFVAARFLASEGEASLPASTSKGQIPAVHLGQRGKRASEDARAHALGEPGAPARNASRAETRADQLLRIVEYLDVEHSARYRRRGATTFCNIYAYDYCTLGGVYLPRVWWNGAALLAMGRGETVVPAYARTLEELNANALLGWLAQWGPGFGWRRAANASEAQERAEVGEVVVICARRRDTNRPGHIAAVLPEITGTDARRSGDEVTSPVQSQAGSSNHGFWAPAPWWTAEKYEEFGFWHANETRAVVEL